MISIDLFDFVVLTVIVILMPLLADLLNSLFPNAKIGRIAQKIVGWILVGFITSLIAVGVYLWYTVYLPYYLGTDEVDFQDYHTHLHTAFTVHLICSLYTYYYLSITTYSFGKQAAQNQLEKENNNNQIIEICKQCNSIKSTTIKTSHCRICKRCTVGMDHHCPFIANCVGKKNHPYFLSFLVVATVGVLYACFLSYQPYRDCILSVEGNIACHHLGKLNYIFLCACLLLMPIGAILVWQIYVISTNTMTIEILKRFKTIPFTQWLPFLYSNFRHKASIMNFSNTFRNRWSWYNLIVPFI